MIKTISVMIVAGTGTSTFERGSITDFRRALAVGPAPVGFSTEIFLSVQLEELTAVV